MEMFVNINEKEIFFRCKIQDAEQLLSTIENNGGKSIVTLPYYTNGQFKRFLPFVGHSLLCENMLISVSLIQLRVQVYTEIMI